ncbi:hypothetical protein TWF506_009264 [Arthrobotrys conoides]|uniref:Uncharacterized protein n=1 Tax=Arthrobotrys conoides TaxID=74498 RepID=A0AAN8NN94_9PEZI
MKGWNSLGAQVAVFLLGLNALSVGLNVNLVREPCEGGANIARGCNSRSIDPEYNSLDLAPLQKRNDDEMDVDELGIDDLDRYTITLAQFDASCTKGITRVTQYQERQELGGHDNPNPQAEVQSLFTVAPTQGLLPCPDLIRQFYEFLAPGSLPEAMEPSYQELKYTSRVVFDVGMSAIVQVSVLENHVIVNWGGPRGGWISRDEGYDIFENLYSKILFVSWGVMKSKVRAADQSQNLQVPNYQLFWVTIAELRNPNTIKVLAEVLRRQNLDFDDMFEIYAPEVANQADFALWTALLGTPEIGMVQEMLTGWTYQLNGFRINAIRFHLTAIASSMDPEAIISMSIGPPEPNPQNTEATARISFSVELALKGTSTTLSTYPGGAIFRDSPSWAVRPQYIKVPRNDDSSVSGKGKGLVVENASFQRLAFEWYLHGSFEAGRIGAYISGPEQHLVVDSILPDLNPQNVRDILYQLWDQGIGSNSCLSYITFMRLTPKTVEAVREIFKLKRIELEDRVVLTIWSSKKVMEESKGDWRRQDESWEDEKVGKGVMAELLSKSLEYLAVKGLLSHRLMWSQLGRPILQSIKIGYQQQETGSEQRGSFSILCQLADRVELDPTLHAAPGRRAANRGSDNLGRVLGITESASNTFITTAEGYAGGNIEVTVAAKDAMEALYVKGTRKALRVLLILTDPGSYTYMNDRAWGAVLQRSLKSCGIEFPFGHTQKTQPEVKIRKQRNSPKSLEVIRIYNEIAFLPPEVVAVAGSPDSLYDYIIAFIGGVKAGDKPRGTGKDRQKWEHRKERYKYLAQLRDAPVGGYEYEFLRSFAVGHLVITKFPEPNINGELSILPHVLFLGWVLASNRNHRDRIQMNPIDYISFVRLSSQSTSLLQEAMLFYGMPTVTEWGFHFFLPDSFIKETAPNLQFENAEMDQGIIGIILGTAEILAVQEMIEEYFGHPLLYRRIIEEIYISWKAPDFRLFVVLGKIRPIGGNALVGSSSG